MIIKVILITTLKLSIEYPIINIRINNPQDVNNQLANLSINFSIISLFLISFRAKALLLLQKARMLAFVLYRMKYELLFH